MEQTTKGNTPKTKQYIFIPEQNITVFELAEILSKCNLTIVEHIFESLSDNCKKHFK